MSDYRIDATCLHCRARNEYLPSGLALTLYTHGVVVMRFFCLSCRELNAQQVADEVAEHLGDAGVASTIVVTPDEVLEWPPLDLPAICETDCRQLERLTTDVFNRWMEHEAQRKAYEEAKRAERANG